jgi:hypothetical protein
MVKSSLENYILFLYMLEPKIAMPDILNTGRLFKSGDIGNGLPLNVY